MTSEGDNPYEAPENAGVSGQVATQPPGPLAMFGIVILTFAAAACAFFCTCFGIGLGMSGVGSVGEFFFFRSVSLAVVYWAFWWAGAFSADSHAGMPVVRQ